MQQLTRHADTVEVSYLVQTGGLIHAGVWHALVDVQLAARPDVTPLALTLEWALGVQTLPCVLARVRACLKTVLVLIYLISDEQHFDLQKITKR